MTFDSTTGPSPAPLPMFTPAAADGFHAVRAPGGYEWWYFDAEDRRTNTQIVAIFMHGFIFHPGYARAYAKFRRRPTRNRPPLPDDFVCAYFCVYRDGAILHQFMTQYPMHDFEASTTEPRVRIGPNSLTPVDGKLKLSLEGRPWKLTARGPKTFHDRTLAADITFTPKLSHAPIERIFLSRKMTGADHHWIIANPLCEVTATIDCGDERIGFSGVGYHDHNFGTGPIGPGLKRWTWGRAIFDDRVITFHHAEPKSPALPSETHLFTADANGVKEHDVERISSDFSPRCRPAMNLPYPKFLRFCSELELSNARVIDPAPFYLRLMFDARSHGKTSTAFCELAYPHRLRWPVLGRMIEMSFDRVK